MRFKTFLEEHPFFGNVNSDANMVKIASKGVIPKSSSRRSSIGPARPCGPMRLSSRPKYY